MSARQDAALERQATLRAGEKLTHEEKRALAYPCDVDSGHDVGDYVALMHVTTPSGAILEPHRAKVCWQCYLDQFVLCQKISPDEENAALRACRIPTDAPLPDQGAVVFMAPPTLGELLDRYTPEEITAAVAART